MIHYWHWKTTLISELQISDEYKSIMVIDNDDSICTMLKELDFNVVKVKIVPYGNSLFPIFVNFNPVQEIELKNW